MIFSIFKLFSLSNKRYGYSVLGTAQSNILVPPYLIVPLVGFPPLFPRQLCFNFHYGQCYSVDREDDY